MSPAALVGLADVSATYPAQNQSMLHMRSTESTASTLRFQWENPNDILSLLLILGPDIISRALAQLSGGRVTPLVFSYGWVAYSVNALVSAFGDGRIMPDADSPALVVGAKSGHARENKSWIIGRLLRDFEHALDRVPRKTNKLAPDYEALRVSIFQVDRKRTAGVPTKDWIWYSGLATIPVQIFISVVPWIINGNWAPLLITLAGNAMVLLQGGIPQWREEKWACPSNGGWTVSVTRGNGSRNVMVILGNNHGLDLEILGAQTRMQRASATTRGFLLFMALLWLVLLICVAGLQMDSWYLLAVGLIGMVHNIITAGAARSSSALGIHLNQIDTIADTTVARVLRRVEDRYELVGTSLVPLFFPGGMRVPKTDRDFWDKAESKRDQTTLKKMAIKTD